MKKFLHMKKEKKVKIKKMTKKKESKKIKNILIKINLLNEFNIKKI